MAEQLNTEPQYYDLLSSSDKENLKALKKDINSIVIKSGRAKFCSIFEKIVDKIHEFVVRGDSSDNIRSLVCGIIWMDDIIAINTRQLILTINKCKSSINSGFQAIGYTTVQMDPKTAVTLVKRFPFMKENFCETRQWTLRKLSKSKLQPKPLPKPLIAQKPIQVPQKTVTPLNLPLKVEPQTPKIVLTDTKFLPTERKLVTDVSFDLLTNYVIPQYDSVLEFPQNNLIDDLSDPSPFDLL